MVFLRRSHPNLVTPTSRHMADNAQRMAQVNDELTDEEWQEAKDHLRAAITDYFEKTAPGVYVSAWVLITHKESIELEADGQSAVGVLGATGQPFPMTRGMLEVALDSERLSTQAR